MWDEQDDNFKQLLQKPSIIKEVLQSNTSQIPLPIKKKLIEVAGHLLTELDVSNTPINYDEVETLLGFCPNIQKVNFRNCKNIHESITGLLPKKLEDISLDSWDSDMIVALDKLPNVKHLDLKNCSNLLAINRPWSNSNLTHLYIDNCKNLVNIFTKFPDSLILVSASNCPKLNITQFFSILPDSLLYLDISHCCELTDEDLKNLPKNLKSINLSGCNKVSQSNIDQLKRKGIDVCN